MAEGQEMISEDAIISSQDDREAIRTGGMKNNQTEDREEGWDGNSDQMGMRMDNISEEMDSTETSRKVPRNSQTSNLSMTQVKRVLKMPGSFDNSPMDMESLSISDLHDLKCKLTDELKTLEIGKAIAVMKPSTENITDLRASVAELRDKLFQVSNDASLTQLIIKRFEMQILLNEVIFKEEKDERDIEIVKDIQEDLQVASEIMRIQKEVEKLQVKRSNVRLENKKLKRENTSVLESIKVKQEEIQRDIKEKLKDKEYKMLKSEVETRSKYATILRNIIPRLAVCAGHIDHDTQELIMQCGEPSNI